MSKFGEFCSTRIVTRSYNRGGSLSVCLFGDAYIQSVDESVSLQVS